MLLVENVARAFVQTYVPTAKILGKIAESNELGFKVRDLIL